MSNVRIKVANKIANLVEQRSYKIKQVLKEQRTIEKDVMFEQVKEILK